MWWNDWNTQQEGEREGKYKYTLQIRLLCNFSRSTSFFLFGGKNSRNFHIMVYSTILFYRMRLRCCCFCWYPITWKHLQTLWKNNLKCVMLSMLFVASSDEHQMCASISSDFKLDCRAMCRLWAIFSVSSHSYEHILLLWDDWIHQDKCSIVWEMCVWECDAIWTISLEFLDQGFFARNLRYFAQAFCFSLVFRNNKIPICTHSTDANSLVFRFNVCWLHFWSALLLAVQISLISFPSMNIIAKYAVNLFWHLKMDRMHNTWSDGVRETYAI